MRQRDVSECVTTSRINTPVRTYRLGERIGAYTVFCQPIQIVRANIISLSHLQGPDAQRHGKSGRISTTLIGIVVRHVAVTVSSIRSLEALPAREPSSRCDGFSAHGGRRQSADKPTPGTEPASEPAGPKVICHTRCRRCLSRTPR